MTAFLEIKDLTKTFTLKGFFGKKTDVHALNGISLSVEKGESLGIVGESGCGKSTLANLMVRLEEPTSGDILLDGISIAHKKEKELRKLRSRIQIVFQDPYSSLSPRMTVEQILTEPMQVMGQYTSRERTERASELLELVGMRSSSLRKYPHEFSGGQRQRISIARALTTEPDILILDEPTSALDVSVQAQVLNLLTDIREKMKLTYLFISHNLAVVKYISDRTAVMYKGRIVEIGPSLSILTSPMHPYTKELLAAVPIVGKPFCPPRETAHETGGTDAERGCIYYDRCPIKNEKCRRERPVLEERQEDHEVSCWKL